MNRISAVVLVALAVAVAAFLLVRNNGPRAAVKLTLRLEVSPPAQTDFVVAHANSARFKYEIGKKAGVKPFLAQKLSARTVPKTALVEAQLRVETKEDARLYADAFVDILQRQCGTAAQLTLVDRSVP